VSYPGDFRWLLRLGHRAKRKEHSAKSQDRDFFLHAFLSASILTYCSTLGLCPSHLMTWFARARNSGESVSPICFAAFKLITNSNLVACCTGKSAGLAPFRILST